jgi:hypothetical protein
MPNRDDVINFYLSVDRLIRAVEETKRMRDELLANAAEKPIALSNQAGAQETRQTGRRRVSK